MSRTFGISIYPEHSTQEAIIDYLTLAAKYNIKKVFTCLLSVEGEVDEIKDNFRVIHKHAKSLGMEVIVDVSPRIFDKLNISYDDLSFFAEIEATGVRLDVGFDGAKEAKMTYNPFGLSIEINMSMDTATIDNIMSYRPNTEMLIACHNFYPQAYTGLSLAHFLSCSKRFKKYQIRSSAFVTAHSAEIGPWPVMDGLCTLEMHRNLPIQAQAKHLFATGLIDTVIIGNMFASEAELQALTSINPYVLQLEVDMLEETSAIEEKILFDFPHFRRGDTNDYMIRSTMSRVVYKNEHFLAHDLTSLKKGDIVIGNDMFGQYKGELHIVLADLPKDERKNLVARVRSEEMFLIDYIRPWDHFGLIKSRKL